MIEKMLHGLKAGISGKAATTMLHKIVLLFLSLFILVAATPDIAAAQEAAQNDKWEFGGEIYMWAPSLHLKTASGTDVDMSFSDILDDLEMMFMGALEARKGKWFLGADVIYFDLEDKDASGIATVPIGPLGRSSVNVGVDADVELSAWLLTPVGGYTVIQKEKLRLDVVAGVRYLYLKAVSKMDITEELDVELLRRGLVRTGDVNDRISESGHVWDGIVGIRGQVDLNEKWYLRYYADVGTGDSDLTWQALGDVGYRFSKVDVVAGYRYLEWDFDDDAAFDDLDIAGPFVGVKFVF